MSAAPDLECRALVELLTDWLEGALSVEERTRFELHLAACPACAAYLRQVRATLDGAARLTAEAIPAETRERLLVAFRGWKNAAPA